MRQSNSGCLFRSMLYAYFMNKTIFATIASYGNQYRERNLSQYAPDILLYDAWSALDFFLSRACFQGRRDTISQRVYEAVIEVLKPKFDVKERNDNYVALCQHGWEPIQTELQKRIGSGKVGKARDIAMVLSILNYIGRLPDLNIVKYSFEQINLDRIGQHYYELQRSESDIGIIQVGPKIASFYLRDLISLYSLDHKVSPEFGFCLQPIDVWVEKLVYKLKLVENPSSHQVIQKAILKLCQEQGISPLLFNQGAWYVGYNAFDILLEILVAQ